MVGSQRDRVFAGLLAALVALALPLIAQDRPQGPDDEKARRMVEMADALEPTVQQLRGKQFKHRVKKGVKSRDELKKFLLKDLEEEAEDLRKQRLALVKFGLMPADMNFKKAVTDLLTGAVAGFYDPRTQALNLVEMDLSKMAPMMRLQEMMLRARGMSTEKMTMVHEMTHALDDQYYDLLNIVDMDADISGDQQLAEKGLVEGVASSVQYDWLFGGLGQGNSWNNPMLERQLAGGNAASGVPGAENAPPFIVKGLTFPYTAGLSFVSWIRRQEQGGWATINKAYEALPASTEQILHPEKYGDLNKRDDPVIITLKDLTGILGEGYTKVDDDDFGEFQLRTMFEELFKNRRSGAPNAKRASEGWDGDRYAVYYLGKVPALDAPADPTKAVVVWRTIWDSERDATEFFNTYGAVLQSKYEGAPKTITEPLCRFATGDSMVAIERRGTEVVVLESVPKTAFGGVQEAVWSSQKSPWTRPKRGTAKPTIDRAAPKPITSANWSGLTYTIPAAKAKLSLRAGAMLVAEDSAKRRAEWRYTDDTQTTVVIKWHATADWPADWKTLTASVADSLGQSRTLLPPKATQHKDRPAWKAAYAGGQGDDARVAIVRAVRFSDDYVVSVTVTTRSLTTAASDAATALDSLIAK